MARVWLQAARYDALVNRPDPKGRMRRLLERLDDLGQPFSCDANGDPAQGVSATHRGHDDHRLTREDDILFWVLRQATAAQLNTLGNRVRDALQANPDVDAREVIRTEVKAAIDARRQATETADG